VSCQAKPKGQLRAQGQSLGPSIFRRGYSRRFPKLSLRIIVVSISPTISNSFSIACPVDPDEIEVRAPLWTPGSFVSDKRLTSCRCREYSVAILPLWETSLFRRWLAFHSTPLRPAFSALVSSQDSLPLYHYADSTTRCERRFYYYASVGSRYSCL
jgi:hypothetical protein